MNWSDEGIVLSVRSHGETAAVLEVFSRSHGRHLGLVHGGRSRKLRPVLQLGNHVDADWKARLTEQLGHFTVDLRRAYAAAAMDDPLQLAALSSITSLSRLLPERDPHPSLFEVTLFVLGFLDDSSVWPALYARWELALLAELGFGLDLTECAATGANDQLIYVSPKSGRAVSASAGEPYRDRMLPLPAFFLKGRHAAVSGKDIADALTLTGHFIQSRLYLPRDEVMPEPRTRLVRLLAER